MKKLLSVLLCIAMLIPMCTAFSVNAENETVIFGPNDEFVYTLMSDGALSINGMGELPSISFANKTYPVVTVDIGPGITSLCAGVFSRCTSLKEVKFPKEEFYWIYDKAFRKCTALTSVDLPYCTEYIGSEAFMGCTALERILIPTTVMTIKSDSFAECNALTIVCAEGSYAEEYAKQYGIPYEYCAHEFINYFENDDVDCTGYGTMTADCELGCGAKDVKPYEGTPTEHIGGSWAVTKQPTADTEGEQTQYCSVCGEPVDVQPYDTVRGLITMSRDSGFGNNAYLYSDGTLIVKGTGSIYNYHSFQLPFAGYGIKTVIVEEGITGIGDYFLKNCTSVTTVSLPEGITEIGKEAFYNCSSLASINIPTTLTEVDSSAFYLCPELHTVHISDIDSWFNIYFPSGLSNPLCNEADLILNGEKLTHLTVPDGITAVGRNQFYNCTSLESVTIPETVTDIDDDAFLRCLSLSEISLPAGLKHIGSSAFGYTAFSKNTENRTDGLLYIDNYLLEADTSITECHIAEGTTLVAEEAFRGCEDLVDITIPTSVMWIGNNAFASGYTYDKSNWENGMLYIDGCLITIDSTASSDIVIKDGTRLIADLAFYFDDPTSVTVPESVTAIGNQIFFNYYNVLMRCYKGSAYDLYAQSKNMTIEYICDHSFTDYISDGNATCTEDGTKTAYCDGDCGKTDTVADVGSALGHTEGEWVVTKEATTEAEGEKVLYCSVCSDVLEAVAIEKLPSTTNDVDKGTLTDTVSWRLDNAYTLHIEGQGAMPDYTDRTSSPWYSYHYKILGLEISDKITHIGVNAFRDCTKITEIVIPDSVETIGQGAFQSNEGATSVSFGTGLKSVGLYCFKDCVKIKNVYISDIVAWVGITFEESHATPLNLASVENVYLNGKILTEVNIPGSVGTIGSNAFLKCTSLTKVTLGEGITTLSEKAFDGCSNLAELKLPETLTTIGKNTFRNCTALTEVYIPSSVTSIDNNGFYNCKNLSIVCESGSVAESFAQTNSIPYTTRSDEPEITDVNNYTVNIKNVTDVKEIRFAIGEYTTVAQIREAEGNLTLSASLAANYIADGVFTYDVAYSGRYTFCIRHNDGTNDFLYVDVNDINTYLESDGLRLTVKDMKEASLIKDMWIAEGTWETYTEIKNNVAAGAKYQATATKLANYFATNDFTYTTANPGAHTVLIRYNDGSTEALYINLTVDVPTFTQNGLQLTIGNIPGVKIIRSAYGEYNSITAIKKAPLLRCFNNKTAIKDAEEYMIQYREAGVVTVIVEYATGYKHVEHITIEPKTSTLTQDGNKVTISDIQNGFMMVRYAEGTYKTASGVKNAAGSKYVKAESVVDGKIVIENLAAGTYTFCVQYDDESYNFYTITVE